MLSEINAKGWNDMAKQLRIAAYTRISVDIEKESDENMSIANQRLIISEYCSKHYPNAIVDFYEDRDYSGYTFEQRPDYAFKMRPKLLRGEYDILIVKDLSRFGRRTSFGLTEFENIIAAGVRFLSITETIDYSLDKKDQWIALYFYFVINEYVVQATSQKVKMVIQNRQEKGTWLCAAPYGYILDSNNDIEPYKIDEECAQIVREIYKLYIEGWGYKKIANYLSEKNIPTPRMIENERRRSEGKVTNRAESKRWSIVTISEMLENDFYIGTLRQGKTKRLGINGKDKFIDKSEHKVFENHHKPILDYKTFKLAQELMEKRTTDHYRGQKKYDNTYSGFLVCGDCGSPMFPMSRKDLAEAHRCGNYHKYGIKACTSHHIRADFLDSILKDYIQMVRDNSADMIAKLQVVIREQKKNAAPSTDLISEINCKIAQQESLITTLILDRAREKTRFPGNTSAIDEMYDKLIDTENKKLEGLHNELKIAMDSANTIIRVNRISKTVLDVFEDILNKPKLDKNDLQIILDKIYVYEDHIEVKLKADIDELLKTGTIARVAEEEFEHCANFKLDTVNIERAMAALAKIAVQSANKHADKVYCVNVISDGDPLEIFTDREGEVIFKKYSPIGELTNFAAQYAETLHKVCMMDVIICDRDVCIACSGVSKKEYLEKPLSRELEAVMDGRSIYMHSEGAEQMLPLRESYAHYVSCAMPIVSSGDVIGCVASLKSLDGYGKGNVSPEVENRLVSTAAGFLGRQLEE